MEISERSIRLTVIFHLTKANDWKQAESVGVYRGDTLDTQGFIHCSTAKQIVNVANTLYRSQNGLVLLCIDSERLGSKLRFDRLPNGESYPHIYGALSIDAVIRVLAFEPNANGSFSFPKEFEDLTRK